MCYANDYATYYWGVQLEDEDFNRVNAYFGYLHDAGVTDDEILTIMTEANHPSEFNFDNIPVKLWDGSLLKQGAYYTHPALRIMPKKPVLDGDKIIEPEHSLEMKIRFSMHDLAEYYRTKVNPPASLYDEKRTIGSLNYLLEKYKHIEHGTPLEFVLRLIDASMNKKVEPIRLADNETAVYARHRAETLNGKGAVIWRKK